jgi:hypothetical protein
VVVLNREAFDAIEFDAAGSGDYRAAAEEMTRLADSGTQTTNMPRSEAYVRAGEQWLLADEPAAAVRGFLRAIEDGGPSSIDPRVPLARALFMLGRTGEAEKLVAELAAEGPRDPRMCDLLAELLVERGDLPAALAWATAGVRLCLGQAPGPVIPGSGNREPGTTGTAEPPSPAGITARRPSPITDENELRLLLSLRFRIRNDLGLPEDGYDRMLDELVPRSS